METINLCIFCAIIVPLLFMMLIFKGESQILLIFFVAGGCICALAGEINAVILNSFSDKISFSQFSQEIAPILEELLKSIPIILYAYISKCKRQRLFEVAIVVGIGFALIETLIDIFNNFQGINVHTSIFRGFGASITHGLCTYIVGIGAFLARKYKRISITLLIGMLAMASVYHAIYNTIVLSEYEKIGIVFPLFSFCLILFLQKRYKIIIGRRENNK